MRPTKARRKARRYTTKQWVAVLASNLGIPSGGAGELDALIRGNPGWYALARRYSANDPHLLRILGRLWA